jgi:hypothetical protein
VIVQILGPGVVEHLATADVVTSVRGQPSETVTFALTASAGSFAPNAGSLPLAADGTGSFVSTFTAPGVAGSTSHQITITDPRSLTDLEPFGIDVISTPYVVGNAVAFTGTSGTSPNYLLAKPVTVPRATTVQSIGAIATAAGAVGYFALYDDAGGVPGTRRAVTGQVTMAVGSNEATVTPATIAAGTYWICLIFNTDTSIGQDNAGPASTTLRYISFSFATPPASWPAGSSSASHWPSNTFIRVQD